MLLLLKLHYLSRLFLEKDIKESVKKPLFGFLCIVCYVSYCTFRNACVMHLSFVGLCGVPKNCYGFCGI